MSFSYANPGSGPSAGGIGWFNFGNLTINPGQTIPGLTSTLNDGSTVTFDLTNNNATGNPTAYISKPVPVWAGAYFGNPGAPIPNYSGIVGNVAVANVPVGGNSSQSLTLSNIVVKDPLGNPITNYDALVVDAESTNAVPGTGLIETWTWNTNGGVWNQFVVMGNPATVAVAGAGTQTFTITGLTTNNPVAGYMMSTHAPTQITITEANAGGSQQAAAIGFAVTKVKLCKNIGNRINSADQFYLNIGGSPTANITTTGSAVGLQSPCAVVYGFAGNTYTITEAMAPGSPSGLSAYTQTVSAVNLTPGGTVPPTGSLPINFTPALGDLVEYTILNSAPPIFKKSVDKTFAKPGDILTYTVTGINPNNYPLPGVVFTDPTPAGTTYIGNLVVSVPYTGTDPATGLTLTLPANTTVTASYQVQVSATTPVNNPIVNIASANVPGGTSGSTNPVSTQINYADLTTPGNITKSATPPFAQFGDTLTYTITLHNTGNVAANNVVVTDLIPAGTTFVPGSLTGATGTPPTLTLTAPIAAGGTATITFKVKLGAGAPPVNPVPNSATAAYAFTVDPSVPNGVTATGASNTVLTPVSTAKLSIVKTASESIGYIGDVITYNLAVTNTGNVPADNVVITDPVPNGTVLVPGSLAVSAPYSGDPNTAITLTNAIPAGATVTITFQVKVTAIPNPNPIVNVAKAAFTFAVVGGPDTVAGTAASNPAKTTIFTNNYRQQISDLISSVALEEAAMAAIANAEGAKIQKMIAMPGVTADQLLCLNKSVTDMTNAMALLQSVLNQKLATVDCQIEGSPKC